MSDSATLPGAIRKKSRGRGWSRKCVADSPERTPPRKIRAQFQGYKRISLRFFVGESRTFAFLRSEHHPRNGCRNTLETVVIYSGTVTEGTREQGQEVGVRRSQDSGSLLGSVAKRNRPGRLE